MAPSPIPTLLVLGMVTWGVTCYKVYQERIPNGARVPHPCKEGEVWEGVGHTLKQGSGYRNPFGTFFEMNGKQWGEEVCRHDSDGDGLTNGQELGDPDCVWRPGATPAVTDVRQLSHPGICTPWNSPRCQATTSNETWVTRECEDKGFVCPAILEEGVKTIDVRIQPVKVPAWTTTYACMEHVLPSDAVYHVVATTPILDNTDVLHHMVLFGCADNVHTAYQPGEVYGCGMSPNENCGHIIAIWSFGMAGVCFHDDVGVRVGQEGYTRVALQLHWNNPFKRSDWMDSSGLTLHVTKRLKTYDTGMWLTGSSFLAIPPQVTSHVVESTCSPYCSQKFLAGPIYITGLLNHMHYLGKSMRVDLVRDGKSSLIAEDLRYNYDNPHFHTFSDPIKILPGDELLTTCEYDSMTTNTTTYYGYATSDEMCFAFISFYPLSNLREPYCTSWKTIPDCVLKDRPVYNGCDLKVLLGDRNGIGGTFIGGTFLELLSNCSEKECLNETCVPLIKELKQNPCLSGDIYDYALGYHTRNYRHNYNTITKTFNNLFTSCDDVIRDESDVIIKCDTPVCSANVALSSVFMTVTVISVVFLYI